MFCVTAALGTGRKHALPASDKLLPMASARVQTLEGSGLGMISAVPSCWDEGRMELVECRDSGMKAAAWARIDNAADLGAALGITNTHRINNAPTLILRAYQKWGHAMVERLKGDFAFVIIDEQSREIFAARDPLGIRPLFVHTNTTDGLTAIFATSIPPIVDCMASRAPVAEDWVALYVAGQSMSREDTAYHGIAKVPPAHAMVVKDGRITASRYHRFEPESGFAEQTPSEVMARYRDLLNGSVTARLAAHRVNGVEISGGLDSSTILALAMKGENNPADNLHGFGFAIEEHEPAAILSVSQEIGFTNNHIFSAPHEEAEDDLAWSVLGHPEEHGIASGHRAFYALANRLGVLSLLSGFGGDEGVTNYAINYHREMIAKRRFRELWQSGPQGFLKRVRRFAGALYRRDKPSWAAKAFLQSAPRRIAALPLRSEKLEQLGLEAQMLADAQYDGPFAGQNAFAIHMLERPFVSTRTESCSLIAANYGVEYAWPLLDAELIQCFLSSPLEERVRNGIGRAFHREAVKGIVPDTRRLAPSKNLGGQASQPNQSHVHEAVSQLEWKGLDPVLQEVLDPDKFAYSKAVRQRSNDPAENYFAIAPLMRISSANRWLTRAV